MVDQYLSSSTGPPLAMEDVLVVNTLPDPCSYKNLSPKFNIIVHLSETYETLTSFDQDHLKDQLTKFGTVIEEYFL